MSLAGQVSLSKCFFFPQPVQQSLGIFIFLVSSLYADILSTTCAGVLMVSWDLFAVSLAVAILRHLSRSRSCSARRSCWRSVSCSPLRKSVRIIFSLKSHWRWQPSHLILRSHCLAFDLRDARNAATVWPGSCFCLCSSVVRACMVCWFTQCLMMLVSICS